MVELLFQPICKFRRSITQFTLGRISQQAESRAAFSSSEQNSHFRQAVGEFPKSNTSPKDNRSPCFGTWGTAEIADQGWNTVPVESFHCTWAPQLCFHFLWLDTHSVHLILNDIFPLHLTGTAQSSSCYFRLFQTLFRVPLYRSSFLHFSYLPFPATSWWFHVFLETTQPPNLAPRSFHFSWPAATPSRHTLSRSS